MSTREWACRPWLCFTARRQLLVRRLLTPVSDVTPWMWVCALVTCLLLLPVTADTSPIGIDVGLCTTGVLMETLDDVLASPVALSRIRNASLQWCSSPCFSVRCDGGHVFERLDFTRLVFQMMKATGRDRQVSATCHYGYNRSTGRGCNLFTFHPVNVSHWAPGRWELDERADLRRSRRK